MPKIVKNAKNSIKKHNMIRLKPGGETDFMQIIAKIHKQTVAATYTPQHAYTRLHAPTFHQHVKKCMH